MGLTLDMMTKLAFAKTVKLLRVRNGLTQEALGLETGLGQNFVSELECAKKMPSLETIIKLSNALAIKPSEFMRRIETRLK